MRTRTRYAALAVCLLVSTAIIGCDGGRTRPPGVSVRVLHAASDLPPIEFLREQRSEVQLDYRQPSGPMFFDQDQYDFNVRKLDPSGNTTSPVGSFSSDLRAENDYLIVVTQSGGAFTPIVIERPAFDSGTDVQAVHAAPTLGAVAVYVEPDGSLPEAGTPLGTVSFGQALEPAARTAGAYRLFLTEPGVPSNTLLATTPFALEEGLPYQFAILGPTDDTTAPITIVLISLNSTLLFDEGTQSAFFAVNAVADGNPRDFYIDDDFGAPVISALPYGVRSEQTAIAFGNRTISVTPEGNPAAVEDDNSSTYARGRQNLVLAAGEPGDVSVISGIDERRRIADRARITVLNGASQFEPLEVFIVPPDTDIANLTSLLLLDSPSISSRLSFRPGDYELMLRDSDTDVVVAGPVPLTLESGGLYSVLAVNGAAAGTVDLIYLEDFAE